MLPIKNARLSSDHTRLHAGRLKSSVRKVGSCDCKLLTGTVVLTDKADGVVLAVVTLHDILRAQLSMSERESNG